MADLVLIKTFLYRHEAESAQGLLKELGIEAIISADDVGGAYPNASLGMGNVKLLVQELDAPKAKEFLQVLDTVVDGELWEEDVKVDNLPNIKPIKNVQRLNPWIGVLIALAIFILVTYIIK